MTPIIPMSLLENESTTKTIGVHIMAGMLQEDAR